MDKEKNRSRLVVFRLSPEEYATLKSACLAANGRSISDYMRGELLDRLPSNPSGSTIQHRFSEIDQRLVELHSLIQDIARRISALEPAFSRTQSSRGLPAMSH